MMFTSLFERAGRSTRGTGRLNYKSRKSVRRCFVPHLEALEDRAVLSTLTVVNLLDSGPGSLRDAVATANSSPGADTIKFASGLKGTIALSSELAITDDVTISGPGAGRLTVSGGGDRKSVV